MDLIEQAKQIDTAAVAIGAGLQLSKRGGKQWCCCPFHQEKTPSFAIYPDGGWYCFGCHAGGADSVAFVAALYHVNMIDAARILMASSMPRAVQRTGKRQRSEQQALRDVIRRADAHCGKYSAADADAAWNDPVFIAAIKAKSDAQAMLEEIYAEQY